ncbi:hypothetical protein AIGOOFII_1796 [Methylobacterium marchantiae]|nr:hypothetical protein AIGOOFII_1796 [Methylobacterium marchantiae]
MARRLLEIDQHSVCNDDLSCRIDGEASAGIVDQGIGQNSRIDVLPDDAPDNGRIDPVFVRGERCANDIGRRIVDGDDGGRWIRRDPFGNAETVDEARDNAELLTCLKIAGLERRSGGAGNVQPIRPVERLPSQNQRSRLDPVEIVDVENCRGENLLLGRCRIVDRHRASGGRIRSADRDGLIGELQPLDITDRIDAIRADGIGDGAAPSPIRSADRVIGEIACKDRRVDIVGADARGDDLADDGELAGIDAPRQQLGLDLVQAIHGADDRAAAVLVLVNGDPDIEPRISIDDVVAEIAPDQVAARAAEEDLAARGPDTGTSAWIEDHRVW